MCYQYTKTKITIKASTSLLKKMDHVEFGDVYLFHQRKNLQNQTIFERTSKKVSFPLMLSQEPGFAGLLQSKLHQIIYFIILQNEEGFYKKRRLLL